MGMPGRGFSGLSGVCGAKSTIDPDGYGRITPTMALEFLSLRTCLGAQKAGKVSISGFVERAVRRELFGRAIETVRARRTLQARSTTVE